MKEQALFIDGPDAPFVGVMTEPPGAAQANVLLCAGGWSGGSWNNNRLFVHLARRIAGSNYRVLRFDWHGSGDSPGNEKRFSLSEPFYGDVIAAAETLRAIEPLPLVTIGICYGATAIMAACDKLPDIRGVAAVSFPIPSNFTARETAAARIGLSRAMTNVFRPTVIKGWFDSNERRLYVKWMKLRMRHLKRRLVSDRDRATTAAKTRARLIDHLEELVQKKVTVLFLYGEADAELAALGSDGSAAFRKLLGAVGHLVDIETVAGDLHGFPTVEVQNTTIEALSTWTTTVALSSDSQRLERIVKDADGY